MYGWFVYKQYLRPPAGKWLTLNGRLFLAQKEMRDWDIVSYLVEHPPVPGETILEASGDSYTEAARISVATGIPTVLGWHAHEWLWRGTPSIWLQRDEEITKFYTSSDQVWRRSFIKRYRIRYIVVGLFEQKHYANLDRASLSELGALVFGSLQDVFLIKVNASL
jgi:uncharacterized membrane protein